MRRIARNASLLPWVLIIIVAYGPGAAAVQEGQRLRDSAGRRGDSTAVQGGTEAPDNTGINRRDRGAGEPTAEEHGQRPADIEMTRKIRRAIVDDDSISTYGHNVKIITRNGEVTLRGPVRSVRERSVIEQRATKLAGPSRVRNELEVVPDNSPR